MKEFLPIIIGIIWFAYKMYQGAQKRAAEQAKKQKIAAQQNDTHVEVEKEPEVNLEDFMKNFFGNETSAVQKEKQNYSYESVETDYEETEKITSSPFEGVETKYNPYQNIPNLESIEDDKLSLHDRLTAEYDKEENIEETFDNENYIQNFDAKKAMIYNVILNRPYV